MATTSDKSEEVVLFRDPSDDPDEPVAPRLRPLKVISVSGAKGGVGKSMLSANLAVYLATIGRQVILADADVVGANLHTMLRVHRPPRRVEPDGPNELEPAALSEAESAGADRSVESRLLETAVRGLRLLHVGVDEPAAGVSRRVRRARLMAMFRALNVDYVVVDIGSGVSSTLLDFHLEADLSVFVTVPEPTAIENTYRFLRHGFVRFLRRNVEDEDQRRQIIDRIGELGSAPAPLDLWRRLEDDGDPLADTVRGALDAFSPAIVLNQTRLRADLELGDAVRTAARRRLGIGVEYLGHIDYDDTVWSCVRNRRLLLVESPGSKSAKGVEKIARRLLALESTRARRRGVWSVPPESHHDILEVERGATDEEVRRAFKRAREIYSADALACYGLFEPPELDKVRMRVEEAYDVLLDPARRRPYELSVFPMEGDDLIDEPSTHLQAGDLPPPPLITPDTDFSGALIRQVRESQGVELRAISQKTKVGLNYLAAIETDDYSSLPAPVYVRGFVAEVAKYLSLDSAHVSRTYVKRYARFLEERGETT